MSFSSRFHELMSRHLHPYVGVPALSLHGTALACSPTVALRTVTMPQVQLSTCLFECARSRNKHGVPVYVLGNHGGTFVEDNYPWPVEEAACNAYSRYSRFWTHEIGSCGISECSTTLLTCTHLATPMRCCSPPDSISSHCSLGLTKSPP